MAAIFSKDLFRFLEELQQNNDREWFQENKQRYEDVVREPSLNLIATLAPKLKRIAPYFMAIPKKTGGSLMRVHRDTRFSKDKAPYKTNVGIQFRHEAGADVHAPGYYLHLSPEENFIGVGAWRPDGLTLAKIRAAIDSDSADWWRAKSAKAFRTQYKLAGESLKTAPRGFDKEHPLIEDLRRKDFIAVSTMSRSVVTSKDFPTYLVDRFKSARPFMRFLCQAIEVPF